MYRLLPTIFRSNKSPDARSGSAAHHFDFNAIQAFETLAGETHAAAQRTALVASCVNALAKGHRAFAAEVLIGLLPQDSSILDDILRCQKDLKLHPKTVATVTSFLNALGYARRAVFAFCEDSNQWGSEQAGFLHAKNLSAVWRRVSLLAEDAVGTLNSSGARLERVGDMTLQRVAVIEFSDGRCIAGMVVWSKGTDAGIKFDSPLSPTDALLLA